MIEKENIPRGEDYSPQGFIPNLSEKDQERKVKVLAQKRSIRRDAREREE